MQDRRVFLLKPCRSTDVQPQLNAEYILRRQLEGVETVLVLDLNVLNSFKDFVNAMASQRTELLEIEISQIKEVLKLPGLFISPGYALGEVDESHLSTLLVAYEKFLAMEFPTYLDAHNATSDSRARVRSRKYLQLPAAEQTFLGFSHLAMLKIHDILLTHQRESPEAKFDLYLEYMDGVANLVSSLEAEVAKYCFCDRAELTDKQFSQRCKVIRANFDKKGSGEKRVNRILNGTRDLMYIRSAAFMEGRELDGCKQDTWLLTRDKGLEQFMSSIYFFPKDGESAKNTTLAKNSARDANSYWRYVDSATKTLLANRSSQRMNAANFATESHLQRLAEKAKDMTQKIAALKP